MDIKVVTGARRRDDEGAAAVEFAILVIPLVLIVFGVMHFGIVLAQQSSLNNAVRSAARYGSVNLYASAVSDPHTCDNVRERAREAVDTVGLDGDGARFQIEMRMGETLSTATVVCGAASTLAPCDGSGNGDTLFVIGRFESHSVGVPFVGIGAVRNLESIGAYKCEYN